MAILKMGGQYDGGIQNPARCFRWFLSCCMNDIRHIDRQEGLPMVRHENRFVNLDVTDFASIARAMAGLELSGSAKVVAEYEKSVATKFSSLECVGVNSGTVSIYLALMALGVRAGDEVIVAPTAPIMSALPIIHLGAVPVYADVTADAGFGFDLAALEAAITPRTKAILCVPLWGYPMDMDATMAVADRHKVPVVEDVAQSHGSTWKGRYLGTFGAIGCFSTHERKLITTGEGAFLLTNNKLLADGLRVLSRYGIDNGLGGRRFGSNFKLGALPAALGLSQLGKLDRKIAQRKKVADALRARLSLLGWLKEHRIPADCVHNGYSLVYQVTDSTIDVEKLGAMMESKGVVSDSWRYKYQPMYKLPLFAPYAKECYHAEEQIPRTVTIPCHEGLTEEDIIYIAEVVAESAISSRRDSPPVKPTPTVIKLATTTVARESSHPRVNEPALDENPLLLYTLAYCELLEQLADTLFPQDSASSGASTGLLEAASSARVDRYVHCRAAWEPAFGVKTQLALRDLSVASMLSHGKSFANLEVLRRNELLSLMRGGKLSPEVWPSPRPQTEAFDTIHDAVSAGVFADPGYGGNAGGVGWRYAQFTV